MNHLFLLQDLIEKIRQEGSLDKSDAKNLLNKIEQSPFEICNNANGCGLTGNLLLAFIEDEPLYENKINISHLSFFYYEQTVRLLNDKSGFSGLVDFLAHRMRNANAFVEIYYQKISLIENYSPFFKNTINYILQNDKTYKFPNNLKGNFDKARDLLTYFYIEQYYLSLEDIKRMQQSVPPATRYIDQMFKDLQLKNYTKLETLNGDKLNLAVFNLIKQNLEKKIFNFNYLEMD